MDIHDDNEATESPRKRLKSSNNAISEDQDVVIAAPSTPPLEVSPPSAIVVEDSEVTSPPDSQTLREAEVGILQFVRYLVGSTAASRPWERQVCQLIFLVENELINRDYGNRYTDFLVNEILPSGDVLHLRSVKVPGSDQLNERLGPQNTVENDEKREDNVNAEVATTAETNDTTRNVLDFEITEEDRKLLVEYFGAEAVEKLLKLNERARSNLKAKPHELNKVITGTVTDRDLRTNMHQAIRRIFDSMLDSKTDSDGIITILAASNRRAKARGGGGGNQHPRRDKLSWGQSGAPWLHFTVYKENKDTMEVMSFLGRQMKMNAKAFQFAGTKDRRGVTVQRACAHRVPAERLAGINRILRNAALGDFEYRQHGLELGDLGGNEFVITLRDVQLANGASDSQDIEKVIGKSLHDLRERGYLNYYGLQRFGSFSTKTHAIGLKILQGDFKGAVDGIFQFSPQSLKAAQTGDSTSLISSDDKARAEAIHLFRETGAINEALDKLPRKFSAESCLFRHLGRSKNDYMGALRQIPRNLRLMYVHAYQSMVWNFAASERWKLYGDKVVEGDLVLVNENPDQNSVNVQPDGVDADGEVIVEPHVHDSAATADEVFLRARTLTAEEAASGKFSIFDIVLPLPGFDVIYPPNEMTNFYKTFMGSEQGGHLDPFDMRRKWKEASLSGSYRKLLSRPRPDYSFMVERYTQEDQQYVQTDLERLSSEGDGKKTSLVEALSNEKNGKEKIAVVLKFQLGPSQYATMALRELMKSGGVREYKGSFGAGR